MLSIASNISTRELRVQRIFQRLKAGYWNLGGEPSRMLKELATQCVDAGADAIEINTQQHYDHPEAIEAAIKLVQQVTDRKLCLSTNNVETLKAGLKACKGFPIINYLSVDIARLRETLPLAANCGAEVVLLVSDPVAPSDAREMLQKAAILIGAANEMGIPSDRILVDPGLIHITSDVGQRHFAEVLEFLRALPDTFEPPVRSTCWIANTSAGAPRRLRPVIETTALSMLAGLQLSSVFLNVLGRENRRTLHLLKAFNNETIYAESDIG
ncbi:MAG: dihydropteroate synthase [Chloroflexi bacterium]|nr:dihydropteroate synthase [Chloroflexota bacterium]